jgi:hypothetical protein
MQNSNIDQLSAMKIYLAITNGEEIKLLEKFRSQTFVDLIKKIEKFPEQRIQLINHEMITLLDDWVPKNNYIRLINFMNSSRSSEYINFITKWVQKSRVFCIETALEEISKQQYQLELNTHNNLIKIAVNAKLSLTDQKLKNFITKCLKQESQIDSLKTIFKELIYLSNEIEIDPEKLNTVLAFLIKHFDINHKNTDLLLIGIELDNNSANNKKDNSSTSILLYKHYKDQLAHIKLKNNDTIYKSDSNTAIIFLMATLAKKIDFIDYFISSRDFTFEDFNNIDPDDLYDCFFCYTETGRGDKRMDILNLCFDKLVGRENFNKFVNRHPTLFNHNIEKTISIFKENYDTLAIEISKITNTEIVTKLGGLFLHYLSCEDNKVDLSSFEKFPLEVHMQLVETDPMWLFIMRSPEKLIERFHENQEEKKDFHILASIEDTDSNGQHKEHASDNS